MIFSLQKRFLLLLLVPVALILIIVGVAGFIFIRGVLYDQWTDSTRLRLEKAALQIRNQLTDKIELIGLIAKAENSPNRDLAQAYLIQQLLERKGVKFVDIESPDTLAQGRQEGGHPAHHQGQGDAEGLYVMELCADMEFCVPTQDPHALDRSLRIVKTLGSTDGGTSRKLTVRIDFDSFLEPIKEMRLSPSSKAALLTSTGQFLAQTGKSKSVRKRLGDTGDEMERSVLKEMRQKGFGTVFGRGHPPDVVAGFYKIPFINWYLVLFADGREILEPIIRFRFYYVLAGIAALLTILLLIRFTTRYVGRSISAIAAAAARVREGDYEIRLPRHGSDEIGQLTRRFNEMIQGLKQRELIEETFGRYVDKKVAEELMRRPDALNLGGKKKVVTIMMTDLRNFTAAAEKLQPEEVIKLLNRHFAQNIAVIERYKGIIVDFYGDAILVFFDGVDSDPSARAADAVRCAIEMQSRHEAFLEQSRAEGLPEMGMGIGIHTGEVVIGNIGAETRAKYGIVGSDVNLTDRIQATAGPGKIIISKETYQVLGDRITVSGEFTVCLKGIEQDRELYEVECLDSVCLLPPTQ